MGVASWANDHPEGAASESGPSDPPPRRRWPRLLWYGLAGVALLALAAFAIFAFSLNRVASENIAHEELLPLPDTPIVTDDGVEVAPVPPPPRSPEAGEALNILVIGSDSRDLTAERGRSDVIVLMHVPHDRQTAHLIHFPRDLFVEIPGYTRRNKINAAYSLGGAPLLVQTLEPLIGVPVDHVVIVDFESFKAMTDAVGGVEVEVDEASPGFPVGTMVMDGATGLEFVRERYALNQGDISRGRRQQAFIRAIMLKALSIETLANPARVSRFVDAATTNLTVDADFDVAEIRSLALAMRSVRRRDIKFITAPWSGIDSDSVAGSIVLLHEEQMGVLAEHLANDTLDTYTDDVSPRRGFSR